MAKCERSDAGFRPWTAIPTAALRRRLLEVVVCGVSAHRKKVVGYGRARARGSERLSELLRAEAWESGSEDSEAEARRKVEAFEELRKAAEGLQGGDARLEAAAEVRRLAKDDRDARETLAMLGAIPPLVGMLESGSDEGLCVAALYALLNLGIGNETNKAAVVKAGAVHKMLSLIDGGGGDGNGSVAEAIVANFLGLSALDANKAIIGAASGAIPFLVRSAGRGSSPQAKQDALRALFNLSIAHANTSCLIEAGVVGCLLAAVEEDAEVGDRALAVLSNVVSSPEGRRAVSKRAGEAFPVLIDALGWLDAPACQEKAAYVLMVIAHKSYADRPALVDAGAPSALLELTLLGTPLAQKRASRILEILRADKGKQACRDAAFTAVSAPQCSRPPPPPPESDDEPQAASMSEDRKAVRRLVQQSLQNNMRCIVRRANLPQEMAQSGPFNALATSKSLPF